MKGHHIKPHRSQRRFPHCAFTLAEVMVAAAIFAITSTALTGLFLQNLRFAKWQSTNVQVTNSTFGLLDQIKNKGADEIYNIYKDPSRTLTVKYVDPSDPLDGYKELALKLNEKNGTELDTVWAKANLKLGRLANSPSIPVSYWLQIKRNVNDPVTSPTPYRDVLEVTLIYRWSIGGSAAKSLGQLQVTFPAPNGTFP